jgi:hypothetical protein
MEVWNDAPPTDRTKFLHDIRQSREMEDFLDEALEEREATAWFNDDTAVLRTTTTDATTAASTDADVQDEGRHGTA